MEFAVLLTILVPALTLNPKSVNLDLETSVLFEPKDARSNTSLLRSVKRFIDDLQQVLDPKPNFRTQNTFTDVIDKVARTLLNFKDEDIIKLCKNLYKKAKSLEIDENEGFLLRTVKQNVKNVFKGWTRRSPRDIKDSIKTYLRHENGFLIEFVIDKLNYLFNEEDVAYMKSQLNDITANNIYEDFNKVIGKIVEYLFNNRETYSNVDKGNKDWRDLIVAGRLKTIESREDNVKHKVFSVNNRKSKKGTSKEIILNKNIEVFVRAAN